MTAIRFFSEDSKFKLKNPRKTSTWVERVITKEKAQLGALSYIFCSDSYLLGLNISYLNHKTLTDVITFDYSDGAKNAVNGEIYISIDRVTENAEIFGTSFDTELHRVMIHGVLHLIGYGDKKPSETKTMRKKEEAYLSLRE